jgi:hypothetical protein
LLESSRISRRERWWTVPEYRENLTAGMLQLLQFEAEASDISVYQPHLIPGVLQTPEAAEIIVGWWNPDLSEDVRKVRYDVRMHRRKQVIERDDPPSYSCILDESVIMRRVGGVAVMANQLEALAEVARRPRVRIRIISLHEGGIAGMVGPFSVIGLSEGDPDDAVLYRETDIRDAVLHDVQQVKRYRGIFDRLWDIADDEEITLRRITAEAAVLRSALDRIR